MRIFSLFSLVVILSLISDPALAQSAAWSKEGVDLVNRLTSGAIPILSAIIGLVIMAIGGMMAFSGRAEWARIGWLIVGGLLVMVGPQMLGQLLKFAS